MLITGKVTDILKSDPNRDIFIIVITKTRNKKKIEIAIVFWGKHSQAVIDGFIKIGMKIDIQFYLYSKKVIKYGQTFYNSHIVAENWREYKKGKDRFKEVPNKFGEAIKIKGKIPFEG